MRFRNIGGKRTRFGGRSKQLMLVGVTFVMIMIVAGLFASLLARHDPNEMILSRAFEPPSWSHPFGLDQNGSDVFAKTLFGARISLFVAFSVVMLNLFIGLALGSLAGYCGKKIDAIVMRVIDIFYAFPGFLLALAMVAMLGPSIRNVILAMSVTGWTGYARLVRGEILHLKERDYVLSAKAMGAGSIHILTKHIWPNLTAPLIVQATFGMAGTIIAESGLSFLGLGAPVTTPTWGFLLSAGRYVLIEAPHISIFPGLAIFILVLGFNLLGDGLRGHLDPKE